MRGGVIVRICPPTLFDFSSIGGPRAFQIAERLVVSDYESATLVIRVHDRALVEPDVIRVAASSNGRLRLSAVS